MADKSVVFTEVPPEKALEIENSFRAATTIGAFVDAAAVAVAAVWPNESNPQHVAMRQFNEDLNAALVKAVGGRDFEINPIPDVVLLIDDHAAVTGTLFGLLTRPRSAVAAVQQHPKQETN